MGFRDWAWRTLTAHGRAYDAYEQGHATYDVTLEILKPGYQRTLDDIASVGWRLDSQVTHARVKMTDVTPKSDGSHEVVKTVSQKATFYFVRDSVREQNHPPNPVEQRASTPTWQAGWYQTEHGLLWWDGTQWAQPHATPPLPAYNEADYEAGYSGFSNGEIVLHLGLTFFTCGLWVPFWIRLARKRRSGVGR